MHDSPGHVGFQERWHALNFWLRSRARTFMGCPCPLCLLSPSIMHACPCGQVLLFLACLLSTAMYIGEGL